MSSINESFDPKAKVKYLAEQSSHTGQNVVAVVIVQSERTSSKHFKIISAIIVTLLEKLKCYFFVSSIYYILLKNIAERKRPIF